MAAAATVRPPQYKPTINRVGIAQRMKREGNNISRGQGDSGGFFNSVLNVFRPIPSAPPRTNNSIPAIQPPPPQLQQLPPVLLQPPAPQIAPPAPAPPQVPRLYDVERLVDGDDDRNQKLSFNHWVNKLQEVGQQAGPTAQPLATQQETEAINSIVADMGGGGGDYGVKCRRYATQVVELANRNGYDISDNTVRKAIHRVATDLAGLGGTTQIGSTKSEWGGFFDYSKKRT